MIYNYPLSLQMDTDAGTYSLLLGINPVATVVSDEPLSGPDALRLILGVETRS